MAITNCTVLKYNYLHQFGQIICKEWHYWLIRLVCGKTRNGNLLLLFRVLISIGGAVVETRVEQNWEIPGVVARFFAIVRFSPCMWDSTALNYIVQSLKHKIRRASYTLPGNNFSQCRVILVE